MHESRSIAKTLILMGCLAAAFVVGPLAAAFDESVSSSADTLVFRNLIGEIQVEGHSGSNFEIEIKVRGADATTERVQIENDGDEINVRFPLDESKSYVYPDGPGKTTIHMDDNAGWLSRILGKDGIEVARSGSGLEIWADATLRVPRGKTLIVDNGVGHIVAHDIQGDLELATGSGGIEVDDVRGAISIDTGSGSVTVADIDGDVLVDTGSGGMSVNDVRAKSVHVDTGSGSVRLEDVDTAMLYVDTGSGGVKAHGVGADELTIDTGSGSVTLELERMGQGSFEIDTGSGGINLTLPEDASAEVEADTGSGGVHLDLAGHDLRRKDEDRAEFVIGGGQAKMRLDTGSGSIRVSQ